LFSCPPKFAKNCETMKQGFLRRLLGYFLNGILFSVPLAITGFILFKLFVFFDGLIPMENKFPGLGLLSLVFSLLLVGFLGSSLIARPIKNWFKRFLDRAPLIKTIYSAINDLVGAFVGQKKRFSRPVLVTLNKELGLERLGFVTDEDLEQICENEGKVAVYVPHSYAFSGDLLIISKSHIRPVHMNPSEAMKYIVSGGVSEAQVKG